MTLDGATAMTKELPVTPQRLREIYEKHYPADELLWLADWLSENMPLYREAVELLPRMQPNQNDHDPFEVIDRARVLLAKVKAE